MNALDTNLINDAAECLRPVVRRTPVEQAPGLSDLLGVPVWLKLECLQETGSFKLRGALFRLSRLSPDERGRGVITCSAGNHGWALAFAGKRLGIPVTVCVPSTVDEAKHAGIQSQGAIVLRSDFPGYDASERWCRGLAESSGQTFISPFDDYAVMAANGGSLAAEVLEQLPEATTFVLPVGGGGMAAGFSFYCGEKLPGFSLVACQHVDSPALQLSLERGEAVTEMPSIVTAAGGIEGGIGRLTFEVLRDRVSHVALLTEQEILEGTTWMLKNHHYLIEPSASVTVAACLSRKVGKVKGPTALIISGRNVSFRTLQRIIC